MRPADLTTTSRARLRDRERDLPCPRCGSAETRRTRRFGKPLGDEQWCTDCSHRWTPVLGEHAAACAGCGREVVGYVPAPHIDGVPCCSQECARVISEREERARG